jgi:hypothetical protein
LAFLKGVAVEKALAETKVLFYSRQFAVEIWGFNARAEKGA